MYCMNQITSSELVLFLNDVELNLTLDNPDNTDFHKLILFLFGFTNDKLISLEEIDILCRLISILELVLTKKLHLLNVALTINDIKLIYVPEDFGLLMLLYKWSILFTLHHLSQYQNDIRILNQLKSFVITIINLVTTKLHNLKYMKQIRVELLNIVDDNLAYLMSSLVECNDPKFQDALMITVHLFSILYDYDISNKLLTYLITYQLRFESYARKLWFLLSNLTGECNELQDPLKATIILNLTDNLVLNDAATSNQISFLLHQIGDHLRWLLDTEEKFVHLNRAITYSLLKSFKLCYEKGVVENFINSIDLRDILAKLGLTDNPQMIRSLHIIDHYYSHLIKKPSFVNSYQMSIPFEDPEAETIRLALLDVIPNDSNTKTISTLLYVIIDKPELQYQFDTNSTVTPENFDYVKWINYIKSLTLSKQVSKAFLNQDYTLYTLITALGNYPCLVSLDFNFAAFECTKCNKNGTTLQTAHHTIDPLRKTVNQSNGITIYYREIILKYLLKLELVKQNALILSNFLLSLYKLFASFSPPEKINLSKDALFQFLMTTLASNDNRDARMLVTRIIPLYLIQPRSNLTEFNFKSILKQIIAIDFALEKRKHYGESTIKALLELATISNGEWLQIIFMKLIDLLGEPNEQHVNFVYNGFLMIASSKNVTPYKLLSPYLLSIAELIIDKPRIFSRITDLLRVTQKLFLSRTREYTTTKLLENYKFDFIKQIADASNMSKNELINRNLPRIIATYLVKEINIREEYIMTALSNVNPKYKSVTLRDLISRVGEITWFILLQIKVKLIDTVAHDVDKDFQIVNEAEILNALKYVAQVSLEQKTKGRLNSGFDIIDNHLRDYVLELVQKFNDNVHHIKGNKPYLEKISSLRAIEFLITRNIELVTTALGQISTCLQASLENADFEYLALRCWNGLVQNLTSSHLISLIDIIISLIFQKYSTFEYKSKLICVRILQKIYDEINLRKDAFTLYGFTIASSGYDEFMPICGTKRYRPMSTSKVFHEFIRRINTFHEYVVLQALEDFEKYYSKSRQQFQTDYFRDSSLEPLVSELLRTIIDIAYKFKNKNSKISTKCAKVLSLMGSLDSNKFNFKSVKSQIIILQDFKDYKENSDFLVDFVETKVLKIFWASNHPVIQLFSAYAIQKFLEVLKLDSILEEGSQAHLINVWNKFSDVAKSTLTPLLSSQYFAQTTKYDPLVFPYFNMSMKYENWLVDFTTNLLKRPRKGDESKAIIFETCAKLIRYEDTSLCNYMLKYAALSHIAHGREALSDIRNEFLNILRTDSTASSPDRAELLKNCFHAVFEVLDYLNAWVSTATQYVHKHLGSSEMKSSIKNVQLFLDAIPFDLIAVKSAECDSYERTILYLERCYRAGNSLKIADVNIANTLQSMYSNINDYDALNGVLKKFSTNNLTEKLSNFQYNESWTLAQESFQALSQTSESDLNNTKLLQSLSEHGLYEEVLSTLTAKSNTTDLFSIPLDWALVGLQASVMDGNLDEINKWLFISESIGRPQDVETLIGYEFAKGLKYLFDNNREAYEECMEKVYKIIGTSLVPTISSSFSRNTQLMTQLHSIYDLSLITSTGDDIFLSANESILKERLGNIDQGLNRQLKALAIHQVAHKINQDHKKLSEVLLYTSSIARTNKRLDISARSTIKAMVLSDQEANIEYAKLSWAMGKQTEAIKSLSEIIEEKNFRSSQANAQAQLQYAKWLDESNHLSSSEIINEYNKTVELSITWEEPYYHLGLYYSKIMASLDDQTGQYEQQTVRHFSKALSVGNLYIFEAMPKLITIWLDFAQKKGKTRLAERKLNQIIEDIKLCLSSIPVYVWYTAVTQILSRIVHEHHPSYEKLSSVLVRIIEEYPHHSLWYVLSHSNSNDTIRKERINTILRKVKNQNPKFASIIENAKELFDSLIRIASFKISKAGRPKTLSLSKNFKITNLIEPYTSLVIPVKSNLEIKLPAVNTEQFNAFPRSASITFDGFDDIVNIFMSLQMPRQVTIRGSDSMAYRLMVKQDDTRKDAKVFEFTTMINRLLLASTEARKRSLYIPNYSVVALNEDMGVIEFVMDVQTMKSIVTEQRQRMGETFLESRVLKRLGEAQLAVKSAAKYGDTEKALGELKRVFLDICDSSPPALHHWFIHQFADPTAWFIARNNFIRSAAVMSMVGYIIGLGDRHGENILFFKKTGSMLHIDFECLFEKGTTLPTPEIVPFRLTRNIVDAMGICGIEGSFRITCEVTGTLLRENEAPLMSILETLLHDPLLDWKSVQDPQAHMTKVRRKIRGLVNENDGLPMNVNGQVDILIQQATSIDRLSQMYSGWAAYI